MVGVPNEGCIVVDGSPIKIWFRPVPAAHTESQGISPSVVYFLLRKVQRWGQLLTANPNLTFKTEIDLIFMIRLESRQSASWRSIPFYFIFTCFAPWGRRGRWPAMSVSFVNVYQTGRTSKIFGLNVQLEYSGTRELLILPEVSENIRDRDTQGCFIVIFMWWIGWHPFSSLTLIHVVIRAGRRDGVRMPAKFVCHSFSGGWIDIRRDEWAYAISVSNRNEYQHGR